MTRLIITIGILLLLLVYGMIASFISGIYESAAGGGAPPLVVAMMYGFSPITVAAIAYLASMAWMKVPLFRFTWLWATAWMISPILARLVSDGLRAMGYVSTGEFVFASRWHWLWFVPALAWIIGSVQEYIDNRQHSPGW
ncbi:MAG: hypothetical protein HKM24_02405 [Gammaproteobacteria bacterium]|nr:hypothetical protein [Gammaproteobacteria bacterium]